MADETAPSPPEDNHCADGEGKLAYDAIALRAYFIALDRHAREEEADPLKDWLEAERQLREHDK